MYDQLIPPFLIVLGILNETVIVDPSDPVNLQVVGNYRAWPLVKSIFARMDGVWANGPGVNCVTIKEVYQVSVYTNDGDIRLQFSYSAQNRLRRQVRKYKGHVRWVYVILGVSWFVTRDDPAAHLPLFVVDTVDHTYSYFDPGSGTLDLEDNLQPTKKRVSTLYSILACDDCSKFIPGYKYVDRRQTGRNSLQSTVDTTEDGVKKKRRRCPVGCVRL